MSDQARGAPSRPHRGFWHRNGRRIVVGIVGFGLVIAGLILALPLVPGPGIVVLIGGLAVLATEFEWAERWLHRVRTRFDAAARGAGLNPTTARWVVAGVLVGALVAGAFIWLVIR